MKKFLLAVFVILFGMGVSAAYAAYAANAITTGNVNLRSGPGVKYAKRSTIPAGYRLDVGRCRGNWCRVSSARGTGWISSRYIAFKHSAARRHVAQRRVIVAPPLFSIYIGRSYHRPRYYYRSYYPPRPYYSRYRPYRAYRR